VIAKFGEYSLEVFSFFPIFINQAFEVETAFDKLRVVIPWFQQLIVQRSDVTKSCLIVALCGLSKRTFEEFEQLVL